MTKHSQEKIGEIAIIGEVILGAFLPIGLNYGAKLMPQLQFLAYITIISSLLFVVITWYRREFNQLYNKRVIGWLVLYSLFIAVIPYGIITYATRYTSAMETVLLTQAEAVYAVVLAWLILGEKLSVNKTLGIICILFANTAVLYNGSFNLEPAHVAIFLAPIIFVFGNMIAKRLQNEGIGWAPILLFRNVFGGIVLLAIAQTVEGLQMPPENLWIFLVVFSFLIFGVPKILWQMALHRMDVSKVTALGMTYPTISFVFAYFLLDEIPNNYQWIAIGFTVLGIYFLMKIRSKQWVS